MFDKLGLPNEARAFEIYTCEPAVGLGYAVWWEVDRGHYHIQPVLTLGYTDVYIAWLRTPSALVPRGTYAASAPDPLTVLAIINHQTAEYLREIANDERILAAARAADARDAAKPRPKRAA